MEKIFSFFNGLRRNKTTKKKFKFKNNIRLYLKQQKIFLKEIGTIKTMFYNNINIINCIFIAISIYDFMESLYRNGITQRITFDIHIHFAKSLFEIFNIYTELLGFLKYSETSK